MKTNSRPNLESALAHLDAVVQDLEQERERARQFSAELQTLVLLVQNGVPFATALALVRHTVDGVAS